MPTTFCGTNIKPRTRKTRDETAKIHDFTNNASYAAPMRFNVKLSVCILPGIARASNARRSGAGKQGPVDAISHGQGGRFGASPDPRSPQRL